MRPHWTWSGGDTTALQALDEELGLAALADAKVLITGESGVGKEVVARLIHRRSPRSKAPFVAINSAGLPDTLLESELFGHTRGSFTGAYRDKPGLIELAGGGTVFLDEIGEMSLRMQAVLLRFLESGELQRLGSDRQPARMNVRIITATNRNLLDCIAARTFREDLYYRLNVIHLHVPPLRERPEDIDILLEHFLLEFSRKRGVNLPMLSPAARARLRSYTWPGNVRELRNVVERLVLRAPNGVIGIDDLPRETATAAPHSNTPLAALTESVGEVLFNRMMAGESFWTAVHASFVVHDITRKDLREVIRRGLEATSGSYRSLLKLFHMEADDYKRFLNFLRKHDCHMPFQPFRRARARLARSQTAHSRERTG